MYKVILFNITTRKGLLPVPGAGVVPVAVVTFVFIGLGVQTDGVGGGVLAVLRTTVSVSRL